MTVPLSILDLSPISDGSDAATALRNSIDLAQHAEHWGYKRYWVAEHHFVAVASAQPAVLIGQIAAATNHIRVGAAAVQLGYTTAVAVVECFGTLTTFYPGRLDLGVGRSGQKLREAIDSKPRLRARVSALQQREAVAPDFDEQVGDILAMIDGGYRIGDVEAHVQPGEGTDLIPWVFGSSKGRSAEVAGARGLPFVASYHITPATALGAVEAYRAAFRPSQHLAEPYVVVSADVVVADDTATARHLASSYGHWVHSIREGDGAIPYPHPDRIAPLSDEQHQVVKDRTATQFVGDSEEVASGLDRLQRITDADELVVTSVTHDHDDRLRSHELLAKRWGI